MVLLADHLFPTPQSYRFESFHWHFSFFANCFEKSKNMKKMPGMVHFLTLGPVVCAVIPQP